MANSETVLTLTLAVLARKFCACGGEFLPTGWAYPVMPPRHEHLCNLCGKVEVFNDVYPAVRFENAEQSELK